MMGQKGSGIREGTKSEKSNNKGDKTMELYTTTGTCKQIKRRTSLLSAVVIPNEHSAEKVKTFGRVETAGKCHQEVRVTSYFVWCVCLFCAGKWKPCCVSFPWRCQTH